jgi:hypothetical protein
MTDNAKKGRQLLAIIGLFNIAQVIYVNFDQIFNGDFAKTLNILIASVVCYGLVKFPKLIKYFVAAILILHSIIGILEYNINGISHNIKLVVDIVIYVINVIFAYMLLFSKIVKEYTIEVDGSSN